MIQVTVVVFRPSVNDVPYRQPATERVRTRPLPLFRRKCVEEAECLLAARAKRSMSPHDVLSLVLTFIGPAVWVQHDQSRLLVRQDHEDTFEIELLYIAQMADEAHRA